MGDIYIGDALELAKSLTENSVQCIVTSPPYWNLRDYGVDGQWGQETDYQEHISRLVALFSELRKSLKDDGVLWINYGDCYASAGGRGNGTNLHGGLDSQRASCNQKSKLGNGLKPKDLVGMPWRIALALQNDGWWLRQDIIWHKPNAMPESVTDRCTNAHEYLFMLTKSARYYYDAEAIKEPAKWDKMTTAQQYSGMRNKRSVWTIPTHPYSGAHFAAFPPLLIEPCILSCSKRGDVVLDPFAGSGTTLAVADKHGREWIGFEINPSYEPLIRKRIDAVQPVLF